jgi:hypothetical protein
MNDTRQLIPVAGMIATFAIAAYMVIQLEGQAAAPVGDFRNAAIADVHDAQGQPLLRGQFAVVPEDDEDVERKAQLEPVGSDTDAAGEAEIEFTKASPAQQEIEFSVWNLQPGTTLTFVIDGSPVGQAVVDRSGRAEVELQIGAASR